MQPYQGQLSEARTCIHDLCQPHSCACFCIITGINKNAPSLRHAQSSTTCNDSLLGTCKIAGSKSREWEGWAEAEAGQPAPMPAAAAAGHGALLPEPGSGGQLLQQLTAARCQHAPQLPGPAFPAASEWPSLPHPIPELPAPCRSHICCEAILCIADVVSEHHSSCTPN